MKILSQVLNNLALLARPTTVVYKLYFAISEFLIFYRNLGKKPKYNDFGVQNIE
jgi:hypothetical protein